MLREIGRDIWVAEQALRYFGLSIGTRMTVIRLTNSELAVISPIQASDLIVNQLSELGEVKHIIAPNLYHHLFAANFKENYQNATLWAAPGLRSKKPNLPVDQNITSNPARVWDGLEYIFFEGFRTLGLSGFEPLNECVFFHSISQTLILTDAAFNFDESFPVVTQLAARFFGGYKNLRPSFLEWIATTEKEKVRQSIGKILSWDFERVIIAHGSIVEQNGKEKLKKGYEKFLGQSINVAT